MVEMNGQGDFSQLYHVDEIIGTGGFSIVKKCRHKATNNAYAVKIINSKKLNDDEMKCLKTEAQLCLRLRHDNIVQLFELYPESNFHYLVLELVTGGELFDNIVERERYSEMDASVCIQQVLEAVHYCHTQGIIHRDIKPENLLLASREPDANVKLTDFGLAVEETKPPVWYGFAGTPCYMAPEVLQKQAYGTAVDCWACGCILYLLLIGYPPFWNSNQEKLFESIKEGIYDFESSNWQDVSFDAKTLIRMLLTVNVERRPSASGALQSRWIKQRERRASKFHRKRAVESLKKFNARRKFKGAIRTTVLATQGKLFNSH